MDFSVEFSDSLGGALELPWTWPADSTADENRSTRKCAMTPTATCLSVTGDQRRRLFPISTKSRDTEASAPIDDWRIVVREI
jgi:hypothetical protein